MSLRVPGHTLRYEGAPHDDRGEVVFKGGFIHRGGEGRALCSCGTTSPILSSSVQRRQWHRDHKNSILGEQVLEEIRDAGGYDEWVRRGRR